MAETQSRPTRGRGSYRGGRGGHSYRGGRGATKPVADDVPTESFEDQGEIGELKKKYATKVPLLKEMFPDWTTEDLVFTLDETNGDETAAIDRITEGQASQWGEVKKKHVDRSRSKVKEATAAIPDTTATSTRGRGRGGLETRGRGRGDRGRGRGGRAGAHTNGTRTADKPAKTTVEAFGDAVATTDAITEATTNGDATITEPVKEKDTLVEALKAAPAKPAAWSALFAKPPPVKSAPKSAQTPAIPAAQPVPEPTTEAPPEPSLPAAQPEHPHSEQPITPQIETATESDATLTPSKDELTENNVEKLPDESHPVDTQTAASTVGSTLDPHSQLSSAAPLRPGLSGYAASALKATATPRSASYQRRILEQQEAVVMPGDRAVDRAAVQFGSMGLNGGDEPEAEEEREQPETRAQPPTDSPVAPRASLPPAPIQHQQPSLPQPVEPVIAARPAPGLPPAPQQQSPIQPSAYSDYGRYGAKSYDPFGQQAMPTHSQPESFAATQSQTQPTTSAPAEYSSYYSANQQRDAYNNNYYGNYMQSQEAQQRTGSAFGSSGPDAPSQYGGRSSGHNTPNPATQAQQQPQQGQQGQQVPHGQNAPAGYPYGGYPSTYGGYPQYNQYGMHHQHQYGRNRPMFDDARRYENSGGNYMDHNNYYGGHYGGSYGKGPNMYGQPQHQYSYDHSASPANASGFGPASMSGRDSGYRTGSAQPSEAQQSNSAYDPFGRSQSGFSGAQPSLTQQSGGEDASKSGPSPSLTQVNRPESATNSISNQHASQSSTFPPPQSQQSQAFGGYPQYGLGGGFSGHQGNQSNQGYGSYGAHGFGGYGYGRSNWGQYGH